MEYGSIKTSGTLNSIRNLYEVYKDSNANDDKKVRFNKFSGKAVVMGSSGSSSRFGLVTWVRKLYTTDSGGYIKEFILNGIEQEHGSNARRELSHVFGSTEAFNQLSVKKVKSFYLLYNEKLRMLTRLT